MLTISICVNMRLQGEGSSPAAPSCQQDSKPLVTELASSLSSKSQAKSSGFRFPPAKVPDQDIAPIRSRRGSITDPSQASSTTSSGSSRMAVSADSASELMTPVATTRLEAVALNADVGSTTADVAHADGVVRPDYKLVYRGHMDLAQAWEGPGVDVASVRLPKVMNILQKRFAGVRQKYKWKGLVLRTPLAMHIFHCGRCWC